MSINNLQTDEKDSKHLENADDTLTPSDRQSSSVQLTISEMFDKQQHLAEIASNTFRQLSETLEIEQVKLLELEERRKKLQEEMKMLKAEIEKERESLEMDIVQSVADNLNALNKTCNDEASNCVDNDNALEEHNKMSDNQIKKLNTCYEFDEDMIITARNVEAKIGKELINDEPETEEKNQHIKNELQNALKECSAGQ